MSNKAHSYHPTNNSLEAKVIALRTALLDKQRASTSLKANSDDRLGTKEEIEYALSVSEQTLQLALNGLSVEEVKQAKAQGLLSQDELIEITTAQRTAQMSSQRTATNSEETHSHKQ